MTPNYPGFVSPENETFVVVFFPCPRQCYDPEVSDRRLGDRGGVSGQIHDDGPAFKGKRWKEYNIPRENQLPIREIRHYVSRVTRHSVRNGLQKPVQISVSSDIFLTSF